ncbi:MAG TPA: SUMF1/EgtB/PvdO family nonheme iron enzyme [archaeon]|nr:SUMF1/EgtB/PvdO family nonheme iron enzyme [archaeon]
MRKAIICLLLLVLAVICLSLPAFSQPTAPAAAASTYRGDINEDGKVNIFDLLELLKVLAGQQQTDRQNQIADVDIDGKVNIFDLLGLLKVLAGSEQPGVIYWGPAISEVTPTIAGSGDTLGIECLNFGENITEQDVKAILSDRQVGLLEFSRSYIKIIVPAGFAGGELKLVVFSDTTNSVYISYTISKEMATETQQINSTVNEIINTAVIEEGDSTKIHETAESLRDVEGVKEVTYTNSSIFVEDKNNIMHVWMFDPLQEVDATALLSSFELPLEPLEVIQNKKAILINAVYEDPGFSYTKTKFSSIKSKLKQYGYDVDTVYGQKASVDFFKTNLKGAGFYFLLGHGGAYEEDFFHIQTGEEVPDDWSNSKEIRAKYGDDLRNKRVSLATVEWGSGEERKNTSKIFFSISNLAIENNYTASDFNGAFIYCAACQGLKNESMAKAFTAKGAATYAGWTDTQSLSVIAGEKFVAAMEDGSTLKEAIDGLEENYKKQTKWGNAELKFYPVDTGGEIQFIQVISTYSLSGRVLLGSSGFSGVTVNVTGTGVNTNLTTDSNGNYSLSGMGNGTYTVTPSKSGYSFSISSRQVTISGANVTLPDFTAQLITYSLSGRVLLGSSGFSGVTVNVTGAGVNTNLTTDSNGNYSLSGLTNGTYTVTPSKTGYSFDQASQQVKVNGANVTVGNFTASVSSTSGDTTVVQGITFVSIPGGTFQMGGTMYSSEQPVHQVTVSAFQMSAKEITNSQYTAYLNAALAAGEITATTSSVTGAKGDYSGQQYIDLAYTYDSNNKCWISYNGTSFSVTAGKENWPVVNVTWYGSKAFALKYGFDLPREGEWEYAARGGKQYEYGTNDGTLSCANANYWDCSTLRHPVDAGSYPANPFGLYDLAGNVWEWCSDWYGSYSSGNENDPQGPSTGSFRVGRGGSWNVYASYCRSAYRSSRDPYYRFGSIGFRVVCR